MDLGNKTALCACKDAVSLHSLGANSPRLILGDDTGLFGIPCACRSKRERLFVKASKLKFAGRVLFSRVPLRFAGLFSVLSLAALCSAQVAKPILTPTPTPPPPSAAPAQTPTTPVPVVEASNYIIGPDDVLQITVWKEPSLSGTFPVRPDGMISMVLLGDVRASGLTPMQLGENLKLDLKKFVQDPLVTVLVTSTNSQRIFLVGEVNHVGAIPLTPGMSPLQAIASGGGLTAFAHTKKIYILRGPQGHQQKIPFNYKTAVRGRDQQVIALQPGDTVVVP
jgi:polysaccharide export outer membrane protein